MNHRHGKGRNRRNRPDLHEIDEPERYFDDNVLAGTEAAKAKVNGAPNGQTESDTLFLLAQMKQAGECVDTRAENNLRLEASLRKLWRALFLSVIGTALLAGGLGYLLRILTE